jgi:type IX secretion system PorP/SprF family membrane protein
MKCLVTLVFIGIASLTGFGQDISNFTQFFINPYTLNPSYAGVEGQTALFAGYRKQWASIEGGPSIGNFSIHTPLTTKLNFGFSATSDKRGITQISAGMVTIGYTAAIDNTTSVRFGLSAGYGFTSVDVGDLASFNDPALANLLSKNSSLIGNAGISFHKKTFHAGLAMPNIFESIYLSKDAFSVSALKPLEAIVAHASNRFYFNNDKNVFEPYLIYRLNGSLPSQVEVAAILHLQHLVWVGASYKQQFGISGLLGFKLQNQFAVGLSYSIKNSGENQLPSPSYEIQLGYLLRNRKKDVNMYSFVDTQKEKPHKKTAAQIAADRKKQQQVLDKKLEEDRKKREAQLAKQKEDQQAKAQAKPPIVKVEEKPIVKVEAKPDTTTRVHNGGPRLKPKEDLLDENAHAQHLEEQEKLTRLDVHADDPLEKHNSEVEHPHAERHEFVKKGGHHEEMDYGDYVIVGVFRSRPNAENFDKGLHNMTFKTDFGYLTEKNLWYVYIIETQDINVAKAERDKYRKYKIFRDAWLLTVHK